VSANPKICHVGGQTKPHFAGENELEEINKHIGDIANVTLYVKNVNQWTAQDLQLPENNIRLHFAFEDTRPTLSSLSDVVFPRYVQTFLDGLVKKRVFPTGDKVNDTFNKRSVDV
jgi:hypothetical protein